MKKFFMYLLPMVVASLVALYGCKKEDNEPETTAEPVDLGLSVKWSNCNIGASKPEGYGKYYAWGEITTKSTYNWSTYIYGDYNTLTKYCTNNDYGTVDNKSTLETSDDVAYTTSDGIWRMPTDAEWTELRNNCTWTWTTVNGVNGYKVSATNGNSIFIPAAGEYINSSLEYVGSAGYYYSSSIQSDESYKACGVCIYSEEVFPLSNYRYEGKPVRPVLVE